MPDALIEVVFAHRERAVARVGDVFVKIETVPARAEREVGALRRVTAVPVPELLWYRPGPPALLATSAVAGRPLAPNDAWGFVGTALAALHTSIAPSADEVASARRSVAAHPSHLAAYVDWFRHHRIADLVLVERLVDEASAFFAAHPAPVAFIHADLQPDHLFVVDGRVSGVIDWADCGFGDPHQEVAVLTLDHPEKLGEVVAGYGPGIDRAAVWAYWVLRTLGVIQWLVDHDFPIDASLDALPALAEFVR